VIRRFGGESGNDAALLKAEIDVSSQTNDDVINQLKLEASPTLQPRSVENRFL
jgi:hypothetical protein